MPEPLFLDAVLPLFKSNQLDFIEWSFDMCWGKSLPTLCQNLLSEYSAAHKLLGHGVSFSLLTAVRTPRQTLWLEYLKKEVSQFNYHSITEHFGFLSTEKFLESAPLPMPFTAKTLEIGINNLETIKKITQVPIGLENLGFAFSKKDVIEQGKFLTALLEATGGFLLLDIHNIYCHMINFDMSFMEVCDTLPLNLTRQIHVGGGSFRGIAHENKQIYCDSHDANIPLELFTLLKEILPQLKNVETITLERLGHTITNRMEINQFQEDFYKIKSLIKEIYSTHEPIN